MDDIRVQIPFSALWEGYGFTLRVVNQATRMYRRPWDGTQLTILHTKHVSTPFGKNRSCVRNRPTGESRYSIGMVFSQRAEVM